MKKYPHLPGCKCGKYKEVLGKEDPWWINAPAFSNCFFTYMRHNAEPHTLNEIAEYFDLSISAITTIERKALEKLEKKMKHLKFSMKNN